MTPKSLTSAAASVALLLAAVLALSATAPRVSAFSPARRAPPRRSCPSAAATVAVALSSPSPGGTAAERASELAGGVEGGDEPEMNPDNPNLPALKGDYDWDAEHAADDDWITEDVPGKAVLSELELAAQATELSKIEERLRKVREDEEYEGARLIGWVGSAETYNSRFAMFFLVVGLLTEYWTGVSIPGQIEEMARVGGFIGPDFS